MQAKCGSGPRYEDLRANGLWNDFYALMRAASAALARSAVA
jgi:hypothetical protein